MHPRMLCPASDAQLARQSALFRSQFSSHARVAPDGEVEELLDYPFIFDKMICPRFPMHILACLPESWQASKAPFAFRRLIMSWCEKPSTTVIQSTRLHANRHGGRRAVKMIGKAWGSARRELWNAFAQRWPNVEIWANRNAQ